MSKGTVFNPNSGEVEDAEPFAEEVWSNEAETELPAETTVGPAGFNRVIVMPLSPPAKSAGGIHLPDTFRANETWLSYIGRIVSVGPMAFRSDKWKRLGMTEEFMPKRGEWWLFDQYQFRRYRFKDFRLLIMHEDALLMRVPVGAQPWDFRIER